MGPSHSPVVKHVLITLYLSSNNISGLYWSLLILTIFKLFDRLWNEGLSMTIGALDQPTNHLVGLLKNKCIFTVWPIKTHRRIRPSDPQGYLKFTIYFMMGDLAVQLDYTGLDIISTFTIWLITTTLHHISYLLSLDTWWAFSLLVYNQWSPIHLPVLTLRSRNFKNLVSTPALLTSIKSVLLFDSQNRDNNVFTNIINNATPCLSPSPPSPLRIIVPQIPILVIFWNVCTYIVHVDTQK